MWDTHISVFEIKFIVLFITCLVIFLIVLLPFNFLLVFTKISYRCKIVSKYLKPYLDAYQAPFKINRYYYFGMELLLRPILFTMSNRIMLPNVKLTSYTIIWTVMLIFLCAFKPFKSKATSLLYMSYFIIIGSQIMLTIYYYGESNRASFVIMFTILTFIAFTEFICTILYYLYINHLNKIVIFSTTKAKVLRIMIGLRRKLTPKPKGKTLSLASLASYEQLQEELLTADPNK